MPTDLPEILRDLEINRLLSEKTHPISETMEWVQETTILPYQLSVVETDRIVPVSAPDLAQRIANLIQIARLFPHEQPPDEGLLARALTNLIGKLTALPVIENCIEIHATELSVLLEATLIEEGAFDVARVLVMERAQLPQRYDATPTTPLRLIRRTGQVVPWQEHKIEIAVRKAFLSQRLDSEPAVGVTRRVSEHAEQLRTAYLPIETVQDLVQEELIRSGYAAVAEAYILYRANRTMLRLREQGLAANTPSPRQAELLPVIEKDGSHQLWDGQDLWERIRFARIGLELCLSPAEIEQELRRSLQPEMHRSDINKTILLNAKTLMERDADFAFFAGRILLTFIYEETLGWDIVKDGLSGLTEAHRVAFRGYLEHGVEIGRLSEQLLTYDIDVLARALDPTADLDFDYLGLQTLYDRYLTTDKTGKKPCRIEAPQFFWMRVAMGLFLREETNKESHVLDLYRLYKDRRFCSSTPTLFNAGTPHSQLSSCYLYTVGDSIESIMYRGIAENAFLSKWAGGLGGSWTAVRGTGSHISGTNGESQGVIPFLKMHNDQLVAVNQCFVPGTKLFMARGIVPIENAREGDLVLGKDGEYRRVEQVMEYEQNDALVEIDIKHSLEPLRVTAGHPLFALRGIPMEMGNQRAQERYLNKDRVVFDWVEAGQLRRGDYVAQVIPTEIVTVPDFSEDDARFYGMMLGDGHQTSTGSEWGLCFNQERNAASLEFARNYLQDRGIHWNESERGLYRQLKWGVNTSKDPVFQLPFVGADLYDAFRKKRIAPRLAHLPPRHTLQLLRGLIETDGCISRGQEITFYNTSELLVEGLRYQLLRLGVPTAGKKRTRQFDHIGTRSDGSQVPFKGTTTEWVVRIPAIESLANLLGCAPLTKRNWLMIGGQVFTRVQGVKSLTGVKLVYDLKVEGVESYMTTSALAHNGGKRAGSGCAYLEVWHNDIFDFLELRRNTGDERRRTHDMNTANWIPDLFMKRMEARQHWTLFRSSEVPDLHDLYGKAFEQRYEEYEQAAEEGRIYGKRIEALDLWKQMLKMLFETGHPWITFKDPCNVRSPQDHVGVIHSSNLCTEITLNTSADETAVCNLGSIVLDMHLTPEGEIDRAKLRETVRIAVRALDNVIDLNYYPTEAARRSNLRHRPIGLGIMGLQYALYKKGINFASAEAVAFNDELMEAVAYYAYEASSDLAAELGTYSSYAGSKWERGLLPQDTLDLLETERGQPLEVPRNQKMDWEPLRQKIRRQGMRNSNVLAIAPTATIANIMGTSPCIEPLYKNLYAKSNLSGDFIVLNPFLVRDLKALGLWTRDIVEQVKYFDGDLQEIAAVPATIKEKYRTAFQIPYTYLIDAAARRQKWIDQSQSLNLFLETPDMKALSHMYRHAWRVGLKTTYYLRTLGASNIEKATVHLKGASFRSADSVGVKEVPEVKEAEGSPLVAETSLRLFTEEERAACSLEAMRNGEACEACQ
jgi:ribonucleoside-diphosphate reductase alpha chain